MSIDRESIADDEGHRRDVRSVLVRLAVEVSVRETFRLVSIDSYYFEGE